MIAGAAAVWALVSLVVRGGHAPTALVPVVAVGTLLLTARATAVQSRILLGSVALAPALTALVTGAGLVGDGPLGYANASAALAFLAAAGALVLALRAVRPLVRRGALGLALLWALVPWIQGAYAAAILVWLLPAVAWLGGRTALRRVTTAGAGILAAALGSTVILGVMHGAGTLRGLPARVVGATLGDLRPQLWHDALSALARHPWLGVGPGRFPDVSSVLPGQEAGAWAHSEYLQWAAETGAPGGVLLLILVGWMLATVRRSGAGRGGPVVAVALAGVGVHATIDYVLHFPLVVVLVSALVGIAHAPTEGGTPTTTPGRPRALAAAGAGLAVVWLVLVIPVTALNPRHRGPNRVVWSEGGGLTFHDGLAVAPSPRGLYARLIRSGAFTVEVVADAAVADQEGPARILSSSVSPTARNLTLGQEGDDLVVRIRTDRQDPNGTEHAQRIPDVLGEPGAHHLAVGYGADGLRVHVDGRLRAHEPDLDLALSSWEASFPLLLGNEVLAVRPWRGTVSRVAVHDVQLPVEVVAAHAAGTGDRPDVAPPTGPGSRPLVLHTFRPGRGDVIADVSGREPVVDLTLPSRIDTAPESLIRALLETGPFRPDSPGSGVGPLPTPVVRVLGHVLLFGVLGLLLRRAVSGHPEPRRVRGTVLGVVLVFVAAVEYGQFSRAGSASVMDVVVALGAAAVGLLLAERGGIPDGDGTAA